MSGKGGEQRALLPAFVTLVACVVLGAIAGMLLVVDAIVALIVIGGAG